MFDKHTTSSIYIYIHSTLCHFKRNIGGVKQTRYAWGNYEKTQRFKALQYSKRYSTLFWCRSQSNLCGMWDTSMVHPFCPVFCLVCQGEKKTLKVKQGDKKRNISLASRAMEATTISEILSHKNIRKTIVIVVVNILYSYLPHCNSYLYILS